MRCPGPLGSCSRTRKLGLFRCVCGVRATWLLFTVVHARYVVFCVRCPAPIGSCSPVYTLPVLCCVCGVHGHLAPVHRCARSLCCIACTVSSATCLLFNGVHARCGVWRVLCHRPLGSCSPVCTLSVLCCVCSVLGHLAPLHRCACSVCCAVCAVSWPTWLLFTGVFARCAVLGVCCPGPLRSRSPMCLLAVLCCMSGVLGLFVPVYQCAQSVCCDACAVSGATWLLLSGAHAQCAVLRSVVSSAAWLLFTGVHVWCCAVCAVSWVKWLLFTSVHAWCVVLCVRCPGPLGSCSPVCTLAVLRCVCGVLGHSASVHRCARSVFCVVCALSWFTWLVFTSAHVRCVVLRVGCPWPLGSCSLVCLLVCGVAFVVSWASWLLFTGVFAPCVVLHAWCHGPLDSCLQVCMPGVLCCVCGVLGLFALVHRCARSLCCVVCALSSASSL